MKISEILLKYKTDKNYGAVSPKEGHFYGEIYDKIFEKFDRYSPLDILEIGIQKGGSLLAWKEFFTNSKITGIDIVDVISEEYRNENFNYIISDIKSDFTRSQLEDKLFDIIIDDGSHYIDDVIFVIESYLKNLKKNGVLIIEDCQNPELWVSRINSIISEDFNLKTFDVRKVNNHYDDFIITVEKVN